MSEHQGYTITDEFTAGLLVGPPPAGPLPAGVRAVRPYSQLWRYRPVRLGVLANGLRHWERRARALALVQRFFPEELTEAWAGDGWYSNLADFLTLVKRKEWFELDWDTLEYIHECLMVAYEEPDEDDAEPEFLWLMAEYLKYIPVRFYNYGDEEWYNNVAENMPVLCVIRSLLDPGFGGQVDVLEEYEVYDNLDGNEWVNINAITPETHPEPLCWLPDVARYCVRSTGIRLLDGFIEMWDTPPSEIGLEWTEEGIAEAKRLYAEALPVWKRIEAFMAWAESEEEIGQVVNAICGFLAMDTDYRSWRESMEDEEVVIDGEEEIVNG